MPKLHQYNLSLTWTGNTGRGTEVYQSYKRDFSVSIDGKHELLGSSDPNFRGDKSKMNPEEMLLSAIASCHMLWFLHLCAENGVVVLSYGDAATATMQEDENGSGKFTEAMLNPVVQVLSKEMIEKVNDLHTAANKKCFVANSLNFPVHHNPKTTSQF